jgi:Mg2+/Co2+ transporter CorB
VQLLALFGPTFAGLHASVETTTAVTMVIVTFCEVLPNVAVTVAD